MRPLIRCQRFDHKVVLLSDTEYEPYRQYFTRQHHLAMRYRKQSGLPIDQAMAQEPEGLALLDQCFADTGVGLMDVASLRNLRAASYGNPCPNCEMPLRTPKAKLCAACGHQLPQGTVAGVYNV
ncbi:MAG: hypothetical protein AB8B51_18185 [Sedimentitalea sp.]